MTGRDTRVIDIPLMPPLNAMVLCRSVRLSVNLLHTERPKLYAILACLCAIGLIRKGKVTNVLSVSTEHDTMLDSL